VLNNKIAVTKNKALQGPITDKEYAIIKVTEDFIRNLEIAQKVNEETQSKKFENIIPGEKIII
tara:strand:+ start:186 stop:374 length:189 start_codon:yes stop_codon:yes gene_type:complete